ncbi:Hypothetical protein A7982_02135 [Minicystis rosea]|nr:Hypothetical protein A7982_02135 [Minicystis rosea]
MLDVQALAIAAHPTRVVRVPVHSALVTEVDPLHALSDRRVCDELDVRSLAMDAHLA